MCCMAGWDHRQHRFTSFYVYEYVVSDPVLDYLQRPCLRCSIHVIFQLYPNMENQFWSELLSYRRYTPKMVTTERFSLYESHPFAGYFLFKDVQSNLIVVCNISSKLGFGFLLAYMNI